MPFRVQSPYEPAGDQAKAIESLSDGVEKGLRYQTLRGVTGVGKTFIMAKVVEKVQKPTVIICHNKTLAAQVYEEMKAFFPDNAVEYFVSYYDYYQPEAYVPQSDTYIAKESDVNKEIEKLRHSATQSLMSRDDVIVVASVSCIYGLGNPTEYGEQHLLINPGDVITRRQLIGRLVDIYYERNDADLKPGTFRVRGDVVDVLPPADEDPLRIELWGDEVESVKRIHHVTGDVLHDFKGITIFPAKHWVIPPEMMKLAIGRIRSQMEERLTDLRGKGKILEAARLEQRTRFDMEMLQEIGYCSGIENYSQPLTGRARGNPGWCLLDYFPEDWMCIIDESHVTVSQIRGMYAGDRVRKETLIEYGFRLPSALDNRPLKFPEFERKVPRFIFTSATPGDFEAEKQENFVEAIVRPTGLLDPEIEVRPVSGQVDDLYSEIQKTIALGERVLITTLTKKMAEELTKYYENLGVKATYLHSDIETLERVIILEQLRKGEYDVLIGINLLREGLDLPEVSLVAIFDADKIGFLRSAKSLIQTVGRASRNVNGHVIMYADRESDAMKEALGETARRRATQLAYNQKHGITPKNTVRQFKGIEIEGVRVGEKRPLVDPATTKDLDKSGFDRLISSLEKAMQDAAKAWDFEKAALLRDQILELKTKGAPKDKPSPKEAEATAKVEGKVGRRKASG